MQIYRLLYLFILLYYSYKSDFREHLDYESERVCRFMDSHLRGLRKADITKISTVYKTTSVVSDTKRVEYLSSCRVRKYRQMSQMFLFFSFLFFEFISTCFGHN
jgi:hypothetical protein